MISWEVMRDRAQLSGLSVGWGLFIGSGISGLFIVICSVLWLVDFVKKEFFS